MVTEAGVVYLLGIVTESRGATTRPSSRAPPSGVRKVVKVFEYCKPSDDALPPPSGPGAEDTEDPVGVKPRRLSKRKIRAPAELERWLAELARPLVFTNGVFDLLHRGHVTYLARARALGAALLVALNARRLGAAPRQGRRSAAQRAGGPAGACVAALECGRRGDLVRRRHAAKR